MFVLKRKFGQSITIADEITVTVLGTGSNGVCLGINAPRSVAVQRSESLRIVQADATAQDDNSQPMLSDGIQKGHSEQ